jgi:integrase
MSVRKREWKTAKGEPREAWIVDYVDPKGARRLKTFKRKKEADAWADQTGVAVREGSHVADSASVTVKEAADMWIKSATAAGLERTTLDQYKQHRDLHIVPFIGNTLLSKLTGPSVRAFEDQLHSEGRTPAMVRYIVRSLGALLADAQERGLTIRNPVRELRRNRKRGNGRDHRKKKLKIGVDIPTPAEIKQIVNAASRHWRPLILTAIFTGLRASELRGLRWDDVDLKKGELHVTQRADRFNEIGKPKSEAGVRTVPLTPMVLQELREWKLICPKKDGKLNLVFPNGQGNAEFRDNIVARGLKPTLLAAGVTAPVLDADGKPTRDKDGKPIVAPKYTGLHSLRHFYASWCINRRADGGLELPLKVVQERMGHSSITITADTYGHLFPRGDDSAAMAEAEKALMG